MFIQGQKDKFQTSTVRAIMILFVAIGKVSAEVFEVKFEANSLIMFPYISFFLVGAEEMRIANGWLIFFS